MPKMKSHSGARKRFKVTGTGKVRRQNSNLNHILEKKAPKRKRNLRGTSEVAKSDLPTIKHLLGK